MLLQPPATTFQGVTALLGLMHSVLHLDFMSGEHLRSLSHSQWVGQEDGAISRS